MKKVFIRSIFLFPFLASFILQDSKRLIGVISFDELAKRKIVRSVEWVNPDGRKEQMTFTEMTIPIDEGMKKLTREFNMANYGMSSIWLDPRMIVFHAMDMGDLRESLEGSSFLHDHIPADWGNLPKAGKLPNGSQFIIDKDGMIYCLAPPVDKDGKVSYLKSDHHWYIKRHADGNPVAIGIENVTDHNDDLTDLTALQVESNARLARWLIWFEENHIDHLTSHHQFNDKLFRYPMLDFYHLHYYGEQNRTTGRRDIGDSRLSEIISKVNEAGYHLTSRFN